MNTEKQYVSTDTITSSSSPELVTFTVDPTRLADGNWCHCSGKHIGEGDISASYSADQIAMDQSIRKPFRWQGSDWVCVGKTFRDGVQSAEAYRLVHSRQYGGDPTSYREKTRDSDAARVDPSGFYHGMAITYARQTMVLCGPPAIFIPGQSDQLDLFGGE